MFRCIVTTTKRYAKNNVLYPVPQYAVWSPEHSPHQFPRMKRHSVESMNGVFLRKPQPHEIAESEEEDSHEHQSVDSDSKNSKMGEFQRFFTGS